MTDASAHTGTQIAAIHRIWEEVEAGNMDKATAREALKKVAWARSRWEGVRRAAIETLLLDEENLSDTRNMLRLMLPTETQWPILAYICELTTEGEWKEMTAALVRSWSRPVVEPSDALRPERLAIVNLYPDKSAEDVVFEVFAGNMGSEIRERDRQDAWSLLRRIDVSGARTLTLLRDDPGGASENDAMIGPLRAVARDLGAIPQTGEQLSWAVQLQSPENAAFWSGARDAVAGLNAQQREGLELRHAAALLWAAQHRPQWLSASRETLVGEAMAIQKERRKHIRASERSGGVEVSELLPAYRDRLSWADALAVMIAMEVVTDPAVAESIFNQAEVDRTDTSTEHGGIINGVDGAERFAMRTFTPRPTQRQGDNRFITPIEMIEQGDVALFHYHMHVQRMRNAQYAGPSGDDIEYASRFGRSCIVFTSIDPETLNADFYQGDGIVIDLGEVHRATGAR